MGNVRRRYREGGESAEAHRGGGVQELSESKKSQENLVDDSISDYCRRCGKEELVGGRGVVGRGESSHSVAGGGADEIKWGETLDWGTGGA